MHPFIKSILHRKTAATLIIVEISLSCAIMANTFHLVRTRQARIEQPTGFAEDELVVLQHSIIGANDEPHVQGRADLQVLRGLPGVRSTTVVNSVPFGGSSWNGGVALDPDAQLSLTNAALYLGAEDALDTMGLRLVEGRDFRPEEYKDWTDSPVPMPVVIITKDLADFLFPEGSALGKDIFMWGDDPKRIVGIVEHMIRPNDQGGAQKRDHSTFVPMRVAEGDYLIRCAPGRREEVLQAGKKALKELNPNRLFSSATTFEEIKRKWYQTDRSMQWLLATLNILLVLVTGLGIVGLVGYEVQKRRKEIGIRRALGASRAQILAQFLLEHALISGLGVLIGCLLAVALNKFLVTHHETMPLPLQELTWAAGVLFASCQIAVLWPASRATKVPPATATRSV